MKKAKDKYEKSFLCADKTEIIFTAFGVKVRKDDLDMCPLSSATSVTSLL